MEIDTTGCFYYNSEIKKFNCELYKTKCSDIHCAYQELQGLKEIMGSCESDLLELKAKNEELKKKLENHRKLFQWILDQWELDTKTIQDKILQTIEED